MFRLGAAAGVIGLGLQAVGTLGGGGGSSTQYVQDNRSMYEADMIGFQSTLDNQRWAEQILNGQIQAQTSIDAYTFQLQNLQLNKEYEMSDQSIQQQYNASLFQNSLSRLNNEVSRYAQLTQYNQAKINADYQDAVTQRKLELQKAGNYADLANSTTQNSLQQSALDLQQTGADTQNELAKRGFDLQESAINDASTGLDYKQQGLDLNKMELNQKAAEGTQALDTQEMKGNVSSDLQSAEANSNQATGMRELLRNVAKSQEEFAVYEALLGTKGTRAGTQTQQIQADRNVKNTQEQGGLLDAYAQNIGQAGLTKSVSQQEVNAGRRNLGQQIGLASQGIYNQEGQLGLERNNIERNRSALTNSRIAQEVQYNQDTATRELQVKGLQAQQGYDVFSKSILPDMQYLGESLASQWTRTNTNYSLDNQDFVNEFGYDQNNQLLAYQQQSNLASSQNAYDQLLSNYNLQGQSAIASYLASMGNTQMQKASGLNSIASNTYSQLGQYGGYSQPVTGSTGGSSGFNASGLSGLFESAMSLVNSGAYNKSSGSNNQTWENPYAYTGGGSYIDSGAYSGDFRSGTINW
jgi:hypothetical protein